MLNDESLMQRFARDGDTDAFTELYMRYKASLFRYMLHQVADRAIAEELFQDVWANIIRSSENYRQTASFKTYIYAVARNRLMDHFRRRKNQPTTPLDDSNEDLHDHTPPPETDIDIAMLKKNISIALASLPEEQRDCFLLKVEAGFTLSEVAGICGISLESAKSRYRYAVNKLARQLEVVL